MKKANQSDILGELLKKPGDAARPKKSKPVEPQRAQGVTCVPAPETAAPAPQDPPLQKTTKELDPRPKGDARSDLACRPQAAGHPPKPTTKTAFDASELLGPQKQGISAEKADPDGAAAPIEATREAKPTEPTLAPPAEPDLTLLSLLQALLRRSGFREHDQDLLGALLWSLSHNENIKRPRSKWVVLHREGPEFAKVTSQEELSRVARKGDIVLLLAFLQTMLHQPLPAAVLAQFRAWTDPLLKDVPDVLLLQALGLNTLKWCLKNRKAPVDAWTVVCHKVASAADEKILLANRLEVLNRILAG
jgi:hypothetical protein